MTSDKRKTKIAKLAYICRGHKAREGMGISEMREIDVEEAKRIATQRGLLPSKVKGTNTLRFSNGRNTRLEIIDWSEFERILQQRQLTIFESSGWMKLMKKR